MRLIAWNCRGAFHRERALMETLRPDVIVVPECEKPAGIQRRIKGVPIRSFEWFGNNPRKGLGVVSYGDYTLTVHPDYEPRHQWIVPLSVSGPTSFVLFAVWTLPLGSQAGRYSRPLFEAFESYQGIMADSRVAWAGDFNANFIWDTPSCRHKFRDFVAQLGQKGLRSIYHRHNECEHGEERDHTFYLYTHKDKGYHLDYVFASEGLHPKGFTASVGSHAKWSRHSDHSPLICDLLR